MSSLAAHGDPWRAVADLRSSQDRYWGVWHEWTDSNGRELASWYLDPTGRVYYYPSEAVARGAAEVFQNDPYLHSKGKFSAKEFT